MSGTEIEMEGRRSVRKRRMDDFTKNLSESKSNVHPLFQNTFKRVFRAFAFHL